MSFDRLRYQLRLMGKKVLQITIQQLNKIYRGGVHALNDLDLTIPNRR